MPVSQKNSPRTSNQSSHSKSVRNSEDAGPPGEKLSKSSSLPQSPKQNSGKTSPVVGISGIASAEQETAAEPSGTEEANSSGLPPVVESAREGSTASDTTRYSPLATSTPKSSPNQSSQNITEDNNSPADVLANDLNSTKQRRLEYFRSGTAADCEVHVPKAADDGANVCYKKFRCHRVFLASASEKLEQDIIQNKHWNGVLQMNGVSPESVEIFLEYIYTFEVTLSKVDIRLIGDIYILSSAYNLPDLLDKFSKQLKNTEWPLEDILPAFNLAFRHNIFDLEKVCLEKILNNAAELITMPSILELQIYALNFLIQHWIAVEALSTREIIQTLQQYQRKNGLNFANPQQFPHFTKIMKYFPNLLLDAEGLITKY